MWMVVGPCRSREISDVPVRAARDGCKKVGARRALQYEAAAAPLSGVSPGRVAARVRAARGVHAVRIARMRTEISRTYFIEAAHRLPRVGPDHKCFRLHGHSFRITLRIGGQVEQTRGWIVDFADVDRAFEPWFARLDH